MTCWDYPITELFGCQPDYPLNQNLCPPGQGFHNGIDYGCPTGTEITVNGVVIGISGATGAVTGPHVHVGHWNGGTVLPIGPQDGKNVNGAKVTQVSEDSTNGKFVRVGDADGSSWVYLHMSDNSKVSVGQVLQGGNMPDDYYLNEGDLINYYSIFKLGSGVPTQADKDAMVGKWTHKKFIYDKLAQYNLVPAGKADDQIKQIEAILNG